MKVTILTKKMIKPCVPTPQNLKHYKISLTDEISPPMNVPLILFYSTFDHNNLTINHLEQSLSKILPRFYPLAGRYVHKDHSVHCNDDEGVEFVEAHTAPDVCMLEYVKSLTAEQLHDLLPRLPCEVDEVTDPIVSVQVTRFDKCGGLAIGLSVSHRIVDADSISTFVHAWAAQANHSSTPLIIKEEESIINPLFNSPTLLPFKNLFSSLEGDDMKLPRTVDPNIVAKRLLFNKDAISSLKAKVTSDSRRLSKVSVVCAVIAKAVIGVDRTKHGRFRNFLIAQAVNLRSRIPQLFPKHSCGNLAAQATLKLCRPASNDDDDDGKLNVGFNELVSLLGNAVDKTIVDCAKIFDSNGEEGHKILSDPVMDLIQTMMCNGQETNVFFFSDWSKCGFYQVDFGYGKPVWTSISNMGGDNLAVLMSNKEGDGIEAWVHLFKEDMVLFEQDEDIVTYTS